MNAEKGNLKELYSFASKHSNYQLLSRRLSNIIGSDAIEVQSRHEFERLDYILNNVEINNKFILDIGGNTGFFTFEMIDHGAKKVHYYEGNNIHAEFVRLSSKILDIDKKIEITNDYFASENYIFNKKYDIILLLNILHHIGDDYGNKRMSVEKAKKIMISELNNVSLITEYIVFQLGFNWKGNRDTCLFENGTKKEMIEFILNGTRDHWEITKIGIAESKKGIIKYSDLSDMNIGRNDELGEFLNRPIFIMKSLR